MIEIEPGRDGRPGLARLESSDGELVGRFFCRLSPESVYSDRAAAKGIDAFAVAIQGDNFGAVRLLKRIAPGARLAFSGGVGEAVIPLATETVVSNRESRERLTHDTVCLLPTR